MTRLFTGCARSRDSNACVHAIVTRVHAIVTRVHAIIARVHAIITRDSNSLSPNKMCGIQ